MARQQHSTSYKGPREAAILKSQKEGWVNVSTPYDKNCVADLKAYIEPSGRRWNPETKFWEIKEMYLGTIVTILKKHFGDNIIQNLTDEDEVPTHTNIFKPLFDIIVTMPDGGLDKVYKALAFAMHPDRGGSNEQMILLNKAYQEVKK